jgi:hypothetical protein
MELYIMADEKQIKETKEHLKNKYDVKVELILDSDSKSENWIKEVHKKRAKNVNLDR